MLGGGQGISVVIGAVDATAGAFRSAAGRATSFKASVQGMGAGLKSLGLAVAPVVAIGAALRSAVSNIREMGRLSDLAADAGVATPMIQKLSGALAEMGVKGASAEMVAKSMQYMARTTGETGAEGFAKVLGQASRLGTEAERLDFLTKAFGRSQGAAFAAIVRDGGPALDRLLEIAGAYPALSDEAAQAGDRASDAMTRASDAIKAGWQNMLGNLIVGFEETFGPLPEVAQMVTNGILASFKFVSDTVKSMVLGFRILFEPLIRTVAVLVSSVEFLSKAVADANYTFGDAFSDIGRAASSQFGEMVGSWNEYAEDLFDFSGIGANADTAPFFAKMKEALAEGGVVFRAEAGKAAEGLASTVRDGAPKGASWAVEGSAAARRIIAGDPYREGAAQSARTVAKTLPTISDAVRQMASGVDRMNDFFGELEAI